MCHHWGSLCSFESIDFSNHGHMAGFPTFLVGGRLQWVGQEEQEAGGEDETKR